MQRKHLIVGAAACPTVCPSSTLPYVQMLIAMSHWSGSRSLASAPSSILGPHWDSIVNTGSSRGLFLVILLLSGVVKIPQLWIIRTDFFSQTHITRVSSPAQPLLAH